MVHKEVPYNCIVKTESWSENKNILKIGQTIYVKKKNHKGIILGKDGSMVKEIGISSRIEMEKVFNKKIYLRIEVKVDKNWDKDPDYYNRIGLAINQKG